MRYASVVAAFALALTAAPALAINVTAAGWQDADATIGEDVKDANDTVVKPFCDCAATAESGYLKLTNERGRLTRLHYDMVEGATVTTTDGTTVGTVLSVQNENGDGGVILLLVKVAPDVLGAVDRINLRRNAVIWNGTAPVINTTIDDLRASIQAVAAQG